MTRRRTIGRAPAVRALAVASVCLVGSAVTSLPTIGSWFVGDDLGEIQRAREGDTRDAHFRPLVALMLRVNRSLGGLNPVGYHLVSLLLHAAAIGLVGWVAWTLARRRDQPQATSSVTAALAGATFALLPNHAEAVSWISARGDLVVACGALLAVGAWLRRDGSRWWRWGAASALLVSLAAKEHAVAIPLLCLAVGVADRRPRTGQQGGRLVTALREVAPLLALLIGFLVVRALAIGSPVGSYQGGGFDWSPVVVVEHYLVMAARSVLPGMAWPWWVACLVVGAGSATLVVHGRARRETVASEGGPDAAARTTSPRFGRSETEGWRVGAQGLAVALTAISLLPAAGLGVSAQDGRGDRLVYLASAFASIALATAAVTLWESVRASARPLVVVGVAALLMVSGAVAVERSLRWAGAGALSEATLARGALWDEPRDVVVVNPADNLRGAYVHRNTLGDAAVVVHGWAAPSMVMALAPMQVDDARAPIAVRSLGPRRWLLTPLGGRSRFMGGPGGTHRWRAAGLEAVLRPDGSLEVMLGSSVDVDDVFVMVDGRFENVVAATVRAG